MGTTRARPGGQLGGCRGGSRRAVQVWRLGQGSVDERVQEVRVAGAGDGGTLGRAGRDEVKSVMGRVVLDEGWHALALRRGV